MKIAESTHTSQESDERRDDVVQIDDEFSLSDPTEEEKKKKGKSFSTGRLWQRKENVIEKATATTPTRPTLKRQGSNSCSGKDSGLLFDALLDAATALDTTRKTAVKVNKSVVTRTRTSSTTATTTNGAEILRTRLVKMNRSSVRREKFAEVAMYNARFGRRPRTYLERRRVSNLVQILLHSI